MLSVDVYTDMRIDHELNARLLHHIDFAINHIHAEFEIRNTKAQQTADFFITFKHSHAMTCRIQLLSRGKPRWAGANDRDRFACA
ncbi:Uncharacterised protein [Vibrio cholerae]|uniref:Uncharacterized protein n=1 Tax=Vibrio cholerae TaxID=666 RepID=A0A655W2G0_VIBCL|nr:Uncharacterised protein [Vibrio cholerae]